MLRVILTLSTAVLVTALYSPFSRQQPTPVGDHIMIGSSPLPTCGTVEYRTDLVTQTRHFIRRYNCEGDAVDDFEIYLPHMLSMWSLNHNDESIYSWPLISGWEGGFVIVYMDSTFIKQIRTAIFDFNGMLLSDEIEFVDPTGLGQCHPHVTMLTEGRFALTWRTLTYNNLRLSIYESNGIRSIRAEEISSFGNHPKIAALTDGGWVIAYEIRGSVVVTMKSFGNIKTSFQVSQTSTYDEIIAGDQSRFPNVRTLSGTGGFAVTWQYKNKLYVRTYDNKGLATTDIQRLHHPNNTALENKQLHHSTAGIGTNGWEGFVVTWMEDNGSGSGYKGTTLQEFSPHGHTQGIFHELGCCFRPFVFYKSAGYGVSFFSMQASQAMPSENFVATCGTLPLGSTCSSRGTMVPESTPCTTYPCIPSTCCISFYGVKQNGVQVPITPVSGSSVASQGLSLVQLPEIYQQMNAFFPKFPVAQNEIFQVGCESVNGCTFLVVVYHCPPCSQPHSLGFPSSLPLAGWDAGSCAPLIETGERAYPMTAFRIDVPNGGKVDLPETQSSSNYFAIFGIKRTLPSKWRCLSSRNPVAEALGCRNCL